MRRMLAISCLSIALAACGGGGGGVTDAATAGDATNPGTGTSAGTGTSSGNGTGAGTSTATGSGTGGNAGAGTTWTAPEGFIWNCEPTTFGGVDAIAVDPVTLTTYVTATAQGCPGIPDRQVLVIRLPQGGSAQRVPGPWDTCTEGAFECAPMGAAVAPNGDVALVSYGQNALYPSYYFRLNRAGDVLTTRRMSAMLYAVVAVRPDGLFAVNGWESSYYDHPMVLAPDGTLTDMPITAVNAPGVIFIDSLMPGGPMTVDAQGTLWFTYSLGLARITPGGLYDTTWQMAQRKSFGRLVQVAADLLGSVYMVDWGSEAAPTCIIRKMTAAGDFSVVGTAPIACSERFSIAVRGNELLLVSRKGKLATMPL